jgi:hypothetical protein
VVSIMPLTLSGAAPASKWDSLWRSSVPAA